MILAGTAIGEIFGRMVRMNDGAYHMRMKPGVSAAVAMLDPAVVAQHAGTAAQRLAGELEPGAAPARIADFVHYDGARPRTDATLSDPRFVTIKAHCLDVFQREVRRP